MLCTFVWCIVVVEEPLLQYHQQRVLYQLHSSLSMLLQRFALSAISAHALCVIWRDF